MRKVIVLHVEKWKLSYYFLISSSTCCIRCENVLNVMISCCPAGSAHPGQQLTGDFKKNQRQTEILVLKCRHFLNVSNSLHSECVNFIVKVMCMVNQSAQEVLGSLYWLNILFSLWGHQITCFDGTGGICVYSWKSHVPPARVVTNAIFWIRQHREAEELAERKWTETHLSFDKLYSDLIFAQVWFRRLKWCIPWHFSFKSQQIPEVLLKYLW